MSSAITSTTAVSATTPFVEEGKNQDATGVLDIHNLTIAFEQNYSDPVLSGVSLRLQKARIHGLVGQSGSGKSLLASAVIGLLPPKARISTGQINFRYSQEVTKGVNSQNSDAQDAKVVDIAESSEKDLISLRGTGIGMIFQNPLASLDPTLTIRRHFLAVVGQAKRRGRVSSGAQQILDSAQNWLRRVGFTDVDSVLASYPHELSGGMRQRVVIALVCSRNPAVIIADEPTTALDTVVQKQVLDLLRGIVDETGAALLLITHDFDVVRYLTDDVSVLRSGQVVEYGRTAAVISSPAHPYTRDLIAAVPRAGKILHSYEVPSPLNNEVSDTESGITADGSPILRTAALTKEYTTGGWSTGLPRSRHRVVDSVDLTVRRGEIYAVIGKSGSGKSTLARLLGDLLERTEGEVERPARRSVQYVFQDPVSSLNPVRTVGAQIARALRRFGLPRDAAAVTSALEAVGLDGSFASRYPLGLSGGEAQRVSLARALALEPEVLILDEPTSALDVLTQREIVSLLLELREKRHLTCVFLAHSLGLVEWVADRVGVMDRGQLVDEFPVGDLRNGSRSAAVKELLHADLSHLETLTKEQ